MVGDEITDEVRDETIISSMPEITEKEKQAYLLFISGPQVGKVVHLEGGSLVLGRGQEASLVINDPAISRQHSILTRVGTKVFVQDNGSTNGTYVNGRKVDRAELQDGDKIQLSSSTILKFSYQDNVESLFHKELYKMAVVDPLTGAYNKRYFDDRLKEEFSYCLRNHIPCSLVMMDVDFFKKINDTYGHPAGDYVLTRLVALTRSIIRNEDILARFGGEEFTIILKGTPSEGAVTLTERLRKLIDESPFEFEGKRIHVTISMGVATLPHKSLKSHDAMLKMADDLLYHSKKSGRNRVSY